MLALLLDNVLTVLKRPRLSGVLAGAAFALIAMGSYYSIANANAGIFEIARQRRVPFRDISRAHPTFPDDTCLYFIDPISPVSELSGMFTLRYGRGVTVVSSELGGDLAANLRRHKNAFVYYFDETGKPIEVPVEPTIDARPSYEPPLDFTAPIRLEGYELPRARIKRGDALVVLLYWRATQKIEKDYMVFVHLVDRDGQMIAGNDSSPHKGDMPTSQWLAGQWVVDPIVMPIPVDARVSNDYRLEIGLYELPSLERLAIVDARGQPVADTLMIAPLSVVEK
jgi:hypothetical protein